MNWLRPARQSPRMEGLLTPHVRPSGHGSKRCAACTGRHGRLLSSSRRVQRCGAMTANVGGERGLHEYICKTLGDTNTAKHCECNTCSGTHEQTCRTVKSNTLANMLKHTSKHARGQITDTVADSFRKKIEKNASIRVGLSEAAPPPPEQSPTSLSTAGCGTLSTYERLQTPNKTPQCCVPLQSQGSPCNSVSAQGPRISLMIEYTKRVRSDHVSNHYMFTKAARTHMRKNFWSSRMS